MTRIAAQSLIAEGADVDSAYLYGDMYIPVIMKQPSNSSETPKHPGKNYLVVKSLHGTHLAEKFRDRLFTINW